MSGLLQKTFSHNNYKISLDGMSWDASSAFHLMSNVSVRIGGIL